MEKYFSIIATVLLIAGVVVMLAGCGNNAPEDLHAEIQTEVRSELFRTARYDMSNNITTEAVEAQYDMVREEE